MTRYDVVFIGSSPNALAGAARLAAAGRKTLIVDTRASVGGPVTTEEFAPGFRADSALASARLDPEIASSLGVTVDEIRRDTVTVLSPDSPSPLATLRESGAPESAPTPDLPPAFGNAVDLLRALHRAEPPELPAPPAADAASLAALAARLLGYGRREAHEVLRLLFMSSRDFLEESVPSPAARAALAGTAVRALSEGPFAQGTLFGLLHHTALGDGLFRSTARGGLRALSEALADKARSLGAEIRTSVAGPLHLDVRDGAAAALVLGSGERIEASDFVSDHDLRHTFTRLVAPPALDPEVNRAIRHVRYRGSVARVHVALSSLPEFPGVDPAALRGTLVLTPDLADIERAWDRAKRGALSTHPHLEVTVPTVADPSLAPAGHHTLDVWVQYVPRAHADRQHLWHTVLARLSAVSPGLAPRVLHHHVSLPEDLEARFGLTEGHLYGGEVTLAQSFFSRPLSGFSHHRSPIDHLYLAGSSTHPGGYSGLSGWTAAAALFAASGQSLPASY